MSKNTVGGNSSRRPFRVDELEENLAALYSWNVKTFEIPDVIGFADFVHSRELLAESLFASQQLLRWGRALRFPYPNGLKLRELVVLDVPDLVLLRASAGRIARRVERRLSIRSFGSRTTRSGAAWHFGQVGEAWTSMIESAVAVLQRGDINAMCATDIARYFPSIDLDLLETCLHNNACDLHAVAVSLSGLRKYASVDGVVGVPIGPEASGVLGNAFLIPIDRMLLAIDAEHVRWMDDFKLLGRDIATCESLMSLFDQFLRTQALTRSATKTEFYDNSLAAIAALRDGRHASLGYWLDPGANRTAAELRAEFERGIADESKVARSRSRFRRIFRELRHRGDGCLGEALANDPDVANIDPRVSGEYLAAAGLTTDAVVGAMFAQLDAEPTDERDALDLHYLRALARKPGGWGTHEGDLFQSIAEDDSRRPPVRCWAVEAFSRTSRWRQARLMESAEAEADPLVRRIKLTTLKKAGPGRKRDKFLQHMCARFPELTYTARWLEAA